MIKCRVCRTQYVTNTIYCTECGAYLMETEGLQTDPLELAKIKWKGTGRGAPAREIDVPGTGPLSVRLIIGEGTRQRELEVALVKPVRLGRSDPTRNLFPEVDLTEDLAMDYGVSREHARIVGRGRTVMVEDLGSTNGTLLNGKRLDPYMPETLKHGGQLQLGRLFIEVRFD